jgi:hypothetical protein
MARRRGDGRGGDPGGDERERGRAAGRRADHGRCRSPRQADQRPAVRHLLRGHQPRRRRRALSRARAEFVVRVQPRRQRGLHRPDRLVAGPPRRRGGRRRGRCAGAAERHEPQLPAADGHGPRSLRHPQQRIQQRRPRRGRRALPVLVLGPPRRRRRAARPRARRERRRHRHVRGGEHDGRRGRVDAVPRRAHRHAHDQRRPPRARRRRPGGGARRLRHGLAAPGADLEGPRGCGSTWRARSPHSTRPSCASRAAASRTSARTRRSRSAPGSTAGRTRSVRSSSARPTGTSGATTRASASGSRSTSSSPRTSAPSRCPSSTSA